MIENQTAYLQGWLKTLKADKKLVIAAAGQAQRAADWSKMSAHGPRHNEAEGLSVITFYT